MFSYRGFLSWLNLLVSNYIDHSIKQMVFALRNKAWKWQLSMICSSVLSMSRVRHKELCMSYREQRFLGHEWCDLPMIFTSENHCQIASRVTQKSLYTVTNVLFYFLHVIACPQNTFFLKTIIDRSFHICRQGRSFWLGIETSPQLICDVKRTRNTSIVTSYSSIVLARANWRKGDLN